MGPSRPAPWTGLAGMEFDGQIARQIRFKILYNRQLSLLKRAERGLQCSKPSNLTGFMILKFQLWTGGSPFSNEHILCRIVQRTGEQ